MKVSERDWSQEWDKVEDNTKIAEISATDNSHSLSVKNGIALSVRVLNAIDCDQTDLIGRFSYTTDMEISVRDASLSRATFMCASLCLHDFHYSCGEQSRTVHSGVSTKNVTIISTGCISADNHVLNSGTKVVLVEERHRLRAMRLFHVKGRLWWVQQHIRICLKFWKDKATIGVAKVTSQSTLLNKMILIMRHDSTFLDVLKTTLEFFISFEMKYKEKFV